MNHLDLCSGIGGWALAFRELGIKTIAFCEIEKYPQQVLQKNFPDIPIFNDLKELTYEQVQERSGVRNIDIVTCSYPCQPFSVAGRQKGEEDPRHLWPDTFRLVQECNPTWFVGENVSGHIKLGLDTVLQDLANEGYDTRTFVIPASSVGAWHKRERIWIIGHKAVSDTESLRSGRGSGEECRTPEWQFLQKEQERREIRGEVEGCRTSSGEDVSDTEFEGLERGEWHDSEGEREVLPSVKHHRGEVGSEVGCSDGISRETKDVSDTNIKGSQGRLSGRENQEWQSQLGYSGCSSSAHIQQRENWWQTQSELCGVPYGVSYGLDKGRVGRIKGLGNAIVPQIAWFIGNAIVSAQNAQENSGD